MGGAGVILAAVAAHKTGGTLLLSASSMLLFHAPAALLAVLLADRQFSPTSRSRDRRLLCRRRDPVQRGLDGAAIPRTIAFSRGRSVRRNADDSGLVFARDCRHLASCGVPFRPVWSPDPKRLCGPAADRLEPAYPAGQEISLKRSASCPTPPDISPLDQARILSEALPHMQRYDEETIVIKYGGHAMGAEKVARSSPATSCCWSRPRSIRWWCTAAVRRSPPCCKRLGIKSEFAAGLRITDAATIEIVEMVLAGSINKQLVGYINAAGGKAVGLCGKDGNMVTALKATRRWSDPDSNIEKVVDLGFVGEPEHVDLTLLNQLIGHELIPVLAPLATSAGGQTFNVNADIFAGAVAGALKAKRLCFSRTFQACSTSRRSSFRSSRSATRAS